MHGSSACFGAFAKSSTVLSVDEPAKRFKMQRHRQGHNQSEKNFWTSSSNDMENYTRDSRSSRRSLSSISATNQSLDTTPGCNTDSNGTAFVNHAVMMWNEQRKEWTGSRPRLRPVCSNNPVISTTSTYENLLGSSRPFPQPVPLPEMVKFLVDVWEQDGLYDWRYYFPFIPTWSFLRKSEWIVWGSQWMHPGRNLFGVSRFCLEVA